MHTQCRAAGGHGRKSGLAGDNQPLAAAEQIFFVRRPDFPGRAVGAGGHDGAEIGAGVLDVAHPGEAAVVMFDDPVQHQNVVDAVC
jgi:hypothetical protein